MSEKDARPEPAEDVLSDVEIDDLAADAVKGGTVRRADAGTEAEDSHGTG